MRVLVISDVHLKPEMFDRAEKIMESGQADMAVQMGDLLDDWGKGTKLSLYKETLDRAVKFHKKHQNTLWCIGNHDLGYWIPEMGVKESGHSQIAEETALKGLRKLLKTCGEEKMKVTHMVDDVLFSHAGVTMEWVKLAVKDYDVANVIDGIARVQIDIDINTLWVESSPIWARPQIDDYEMAPAGLQVVGHTPAKTPEQKGNVLSTDVFSTYSDGRPIGDERFVIVDTETCEWSIAKEPEHTRVIRDNPKLEMFIEFFEKQMGAHFKDADTGERITTIKEDDNEMEKEKNDRSSRS